MMRVAGSQTPTVTMDVMAAAAAVAVVAAVICAAEPRAVVATLAAALAELSHSDANSVAAAASATGQSAVFVNHSAI